MEETKTTTKIEVRKLEPSKGKHLRNKKTLDCFEGAIYLGVYDSADNYEEITDSEYKSYLKKLEEKANADRY